MITVEKLEKGTYFDDAFKISFRYDPTTVAKVKELAERRYLPEDRAWEIPAHELPALIEKVGLSNIKSEEAVVQALNTKEIEDKREATQERLKGIKPVRDFDFKTAPLPHQIEAFNYGMEKNSLLIGDEQGLGKTKESIDICVPEYLIILLRSLKQKAYIENLEAELNECKMLNNQLMSDLDADEGLAEICVNEFIADTIKAVKDAGVKKITVEF